MKISVLPTRGFVRSRSATKACQRAERIRATTTAPVAREAARRATVRVRSTFSDHPGTSIQEVSAVELRDKVRAMALDRKVAKVTIVGVPDRPGIARSIFEPMADQGLNVDMIGRMRNRRVEVYGTRSARGSWWRPGAAGSARNV